jgi:hypothetical protein
MSDMQREALAVLAELWRTVTGRAAGSVDGAPRKWPEVTVVVVFFAAACSYGGETAAKVKPRNAPDGLDGTWELIDVIGDWPYQTPPTHLIIEGNKWQWRVPFKEFLPGVNPSGAKEVISGIRVRYDPARKPAAVDFLPGGSFRTDRGDPIPCFVRRKALCDENPHWRSIVCEATSWRSAKAESGFSRSTLSTRGLPRFLRRGIQSRFCAFTAELLPARLKTAIVIQPHSAIWIEFMNHGFNESRSNKAMWSCEVT